MKKILNIIIDFLKGIAIGISNVIPGFSGGTMAVILKVYERFISAINNVTKHLWLAIKDIWAVFIGMILGVVLASYTIIYALNAFPIQTVMLFVGLIIGSMPMIYDNLKSYKKENEKLIGIKEVIVFIIFAAIVVVLPFLNVRPGVGEVSVVTYIMVFLMGIVSASTMIIPGISGSLVLMIFGYYIIIIDNVKAAISAVLHFRFSGAGISLLILLVFGIGCVIGAIGIAKLIEILFKKFPKLVYSAILGLLVASIFSIIYTTAVDYKDVIDFSSPLLYIVSVVLMIVGACIAVLMYIYDKKHPKIEEEEINENN